MTEGGTPIRPKTIRRGPFDQKLKLLRGFWEGTQVVPRPKDGRALSDEMTDLIGGAKETIIISSPRVTLADAKVAMEKAHARGVRIYAVTTSVENHRNFFTCGIMRENSALASTYVLADWGKRPDGVWFPGDLTKESKPATIVRLNGDQISEAQAHFCHRFWRADGQELFYGKMRTIANLDGEKPDIPAQLSWTARDGRLKKLEESEISRLYLPRGKPPTFTCHTSAKMLAIPLDQGARETIRALDFGWTELKATKDRVFGYAELNTAKGDCIAFDWDFAFALDETQAKAIESSRPRLEWEFRKEKPLGQVSGQVILNTDNWDQPPSRSVQDNDVVSLEELESATMKDWLDERPEAAIPDETRLLRNVEYAWTLSPPRLPTGATKHRLYRHWDRYDSEFSEEVSRIVRGLTEAMAKQKSTKEKKSKTIVKISKWHQLVQDLESLRRENWRNKEDINDVRMGLNRLDEIRRIFNEDVHGVKGDAKEGDEPNELQMVLRHTIDERRIDIPPDTLPKVGTLFEKGTKTYLQVEFMEEIPEATRISERFRAELVARQGD